MFSNPSKTKLNFSATFLLSSTNALHLDQSKILSFGKELILYHIIKNFKTENEALKTLREMENMLVECFQYE